MTKSFKKIVLGGAMVVAVGSAIVIGNGSLVTNVLAANNNQKAPVVSADTFSTQADASLGQKAFNAKGDGNTASVQYNVNPALKMNVKDLTDAQTKSGYVIIPKNGGQVIAKKTDDGKLQIISNNVKPSFISGTPGKNDITQENAIEIAKKAIIKKYALTDKTLSRFSISAKFNVINPGKPEWGIDFYPTIQEDFSEIGNYYIIINSPSGEVTKVLSAADGLG